MKMQPMKTLRLIFPAAALLLLAVPLFAQNDPRTLTGTVHLPDGSPAVGVPVQLIFGGAKAETDDQGRFSLEYRPQLIIRGQEIPQLAGTPCLLARDEARNLAVAQDLDEGTSAYDLKLAPALTLFGRVECDGKLLTNQVSAHLTFWTGRGGKGINDLARTNTPGQYEIPALPPGGKYGLVISAPGYGQKQIDNLAVSVEPGRQEVDPVELRPANLKLAGQVLGVNEKPVANCNVFLHGDGQPGGYVRTDSEGRFAFAQVCAGPVQVIASGQGTFGSIAAKGGDTNVVLQMNQQASDAKAHELQGTVRDASGQPVAGAQVAVFPANRGTRWFQTDTNGSYHLTWSKFSQDPNGVAWVIARDLMRGQAVKEELPEEATNLNVTLQPALTVAGQVKNAEGAPLPSARIRFLFKTGNHFEFLGENDDEKPVNAEGRFEIKNLPPEAQYSLTVMAKGYGSRYQNLNLNGETNRLELETFVLNPADQIIAGQVLDTDGKPVAGVNVQIISSNNGQPEGDLSTGRLGRFSFKVCQGMIPLYATTPLQNGSFTSGQAVAMAGDTNIIIYMRPSSISPISPPASARLALKGNPLPDLATVHLTAVDAPAGQPVVLCLFDANQRPSRHMLQVLNQQAAALQARRVTMLAVQVSVLSDTAFNEWKTSSGVTFPVGRVTEATEQTKWATRLNALPWLVLADAKHVVVAEGFSLDDLAAQLDKLVK